MIELPWARMKTAAPRDVDDVWIEFLDHPPVMMKAADWFCLDLPPCVRRLPANTRVVIVHRAPEKVVTLLGGAVCAQRVDHHEEGYGLLFYDAHAEYDGHRYETLDRLEAHLNAQRG